MKFDKRAFAYDNGAEGRLSRRFYSLLVQQVEVQRGCAVLDVGCGTGTILKMLGERVEIRGYGIDAEENMIAEARRKCPQMKFSVASCNRTPFDDGQFDTIIACMAYHHFDDKIGFAKEAARITKPGGSVYITDPRFPWIVRKPLNLAMRIHRVAGYFGTSQEIEKDFSAYGFKLTDAAFDRYAQCIRLRKE